MVKTDKEESIGKRLKELAFRCPIGWHQGRLIRSRTTTDKDIIQWTEELLALAESV